MFCEYKHFFVSNKNLRLYNIKIILCFYKIIILLLPRVLFYFYQKRSFITPKSEEHDFLHFLTKSALSGGVLFERALPKQERSLKFWEERAPKMRALFECSLALSPTQHKIPRQRLTNWIKRDISIISKKKHYFSPLAALNKILQHEYKVTIKPSFYPKLKKEVVDGEV